jgi:hypothetical protein
MTVQEMLDEVKSLGRITIDSTDDILTHYIDILSNEAIMFTQRLELSKALSDLVVNYTIKWNNANALNDAKNVTSVKRGDTQTQFKAEGTNIQEDLLNSFRGSLRSMKQIRAVIS